MALSILKSEKPHIAFFGCTNAGKSSVVNAITNQQLSIVSDKKGTTTDAVQKSMELLPIGPVVIIDTAGINDKEKNGKDDLGALRINATKRILDKTDVAVLIVDYTSGMQKEDIEFTDILKKRNIPYLIAYNKCDLAHKSLDNSGEKADLLISAKTGEGINTLKEMLSDIINKNKQEKYIIRNKLNKGDIVVLVIPIDESAPKGRIILPQQNILREILDSNAIAVCTQVEELENILTTLTPQYVITDSQVFNKVKTIVPDNIILTSFSILMANYKGDLEWLIQGAKVISDLNDGDKVLISESCSHHRQCNDIGTVKFPAWIKEFTGKNIDFEFTQGEEFPQDLKKYKLVIHCGGCMINEQEMKSRLNYAKEQNIPIVNYGMAIAYMNGILDRALKIFK